MLFRSNDTATTEIYTSPHTLSLHDALPITIIRSVLALKARILWTEIVERTAEPWQILSTLLGVLELAKLGEVRVNQPRPFANVEITRDTASEAA